MLKLNLSLWLILICLVVQSSAVTLRFELTDATQEHYVQVYGQTLKARWDQGTPVGYLEGYELSRGRLELDCERANSFQVFTKQVTVGAPKWVKIGAAIEIAGLTRGKELEVGSVIVSIIK